MGKSNSLRETIFNKITDYGKKAGQLGRRVRERVFGFRLRSTINSDRRVLPVKLLHEHRLLQRWRAYRQAGGSHSSIAQHALDKARHGKQQP